MSHAVIRKLGWFRVVFSAGMLITGAPPLFAQGFLQEKPGEGLTVLHGVQSQRNYVVYVDGTPGTDISDRVQAAIDKIRHHGGTVVFPPGSYVLTKPVTIAPEGRSRQRGYIEGIIIDGNGANITWKGKDEGAIIDLPGPWGCTVRNIRLSGERGRYFGRLVGVRYCGGIERHANGGKNNRFENITITNVGVGIEVGNLFGPDLVGGTFINTAVSHCRIGYHLMGANVTSMVFINPLVSGFEEAGFKIRGHTARRIRASEDEEIPTPEAPGEPAVLTDVLTGEEIFQKDLPAWMTAKDVRYPTWWGEFRGYKGLWAGGGSLDVTIYGLLGHSSHVESWCIDTNWGKVRVYSARVEGMGGLFRSSNRTLPIGNYANVLMDINANALGLNGNAIELHGAGPLYLIGGTYRANIAVGQDSIVYTMGTRFLPWSNTMGALLSLDFKEPPTDRITFTDELKHLGNLRGKARRVKVKHVADPAWVKLPGTQGARVHEMSQSARLTVDVPQGATSVEAPLTGLNEQPDANYQVAVTPSFNAGGTWVSRKQRNRAIVNFVNPAPAGAKLDVIVTHDPYRRAKP